MTLDTFSGLHATCITEHGSCSKNSALLFCCALCTCVGFLPAFFTEVSLWAPTELAISTLRDEEGNDLITCENITTHTEEVSTPQVSKQQQPEWIVNIVRCTDLVWTQWLQVQHFPPHQPLHVQAQQEIPPYACPQIDGTSRCGKHLLLSPIAQDRNRVYLMPPFVLFFLKKAYFYS